MSAISAIEAGTEPVLIIFSSSSFRSDLIFLFSFSTLISDVFEELTI